MRSLCMVLVGTLAGLVLAPSLATADEVQDQLLLMQERMTQLEDRLQATSDELAAANQRADAQHKLIERAGLSDDRAAASGVAAFLETLEIGGWVSASYNYNLDDPDGRDQPGFNNPGSVAGLSGAYPFHSDANSFQLDQFWLELERPVSEEHRAGFRADLVYGRTADLLSNGSSDGLSGTDEDLELYQAYLQYLAPIGEGVNFQFGKFRTPIGAEVVQTPYNFNITRGHLWTLFQPITHVGVMASTDWGEGFTTKLGLVNETRSNADIEVNKDKAILWSLGWSEDTVSASFNGVYGSADSSQANFGIPDTNAGDKETILDLILRWNPSDDFSAYVNADYIESEN
ncbi:MAG: outer membrane beta-barrel protein, partial [Planctomycetota bacterium]